MAMNAQERPRKRRRLKRLSERKPDLDDWVSDFIVYEEEDLASGRQESKRKLDGRKVRARVLAQRRVGTAKGRQRIEDGNQVDERADKAPGLAPLGEQSVVLNRDAWHQRVKERDEARTETLGRGNLEEVVPALGLASRLKIHQVTGLAWCMLREAIPFRGCRGGIVVDDMGTGKTLLMLTLIAMDRISGYANDPELDYMHNPPTLVICPAPLVRSWRDEWQKHFNASRVNILFPTVTSNGRRRDVPIDELLQADAVVLSYDTLRSMYTSLLRALKGDMRRRPDRYRRWLKVGARAKTLDACAANLLAGFEVLWSEPAQWGLAQFVFGYPFLRLVLDESSKCSNPSTRNFAAVSAVRAERRWLLSGTPIENRIGDLYSQLRILGVQKRCKALGSVRRWRSFLRHGEKTIEGESQVHHGATEEALDALKRKALNVLVMRRETHTISLADKLGDYTQRAGAGNGQGWDDYRAWRADQRFIRQRPNMRAFYAERAALESYVEVDRPTAPGWRSLSQEKLRRAPSPVRQLGAGFYWDTPQTEFTRGVSRVSSWLEEALGFGLARIVSNLQLMRATAMRHRPQHWQLDKVQAAIESAADLCWRDGTRIEVWNGPRKAKPVLLVSHMSPLERAVYGFVIERGKQRMRAAAKRDRATSAFVTTTYARVATIDYRFAAGASRLLHNGRGSLYDKGAETVEFVANPAHAEQEKRDLQLAVALNDEADAGQDEKQELSVNFQVLLDAAKEDIGGVYRVPAEPPTKARMVLRYIRAAPPDDKILVFINQTKPFDYLRAYLEDNGVSVAVLRGQQSSKEREASLKHFRDTRSDEGARVFILSEALATYGYNFQGANHVILYSASWNPSRDEQGKARIDRIGQTKPMYFVYLALRHTIDEVVLKRAASKVALANHAIGSDDGVVASTSNMQRPAPDAAVYMDVSKPLPDKGTESLEELLNGPRVNLLETKTGASPWRDIEGQDGRLNQVRFAKAVIADAEHACKK